MLVVFALAEKIRLGIQLTWMTASEKSKDFVYDLVTVKVPQWRTIKEMRWVERGKPHERATQTLVGETEMFEIDDYHQIKIANFYLEQNMAYS